MVLDDPFDDPEPKPGPLFTFGSYKGLKDGAGHLRGNTGTGVGNQYLHDAAKFVLPVNVTCADMQTSAVRHGVLGVDYQVGQYLADLVGGNNGIRKRTQPRQQFNVRSLELPAQNEQCVFNNGVDADRFDLFGVAIESQHLANNASHTLCLRLKNVVNGRCALRNGTGQKIDGVLDRFHGVVDLMGDGGRQTSCRGELFYLQHATFHFELLHFA